MVPQPQKTATTVRGVRDLPIRVMIVDDSAVIRGLISRWIDAEPGIEVVSSAANGLMALNSLRKCGAEIILLDIEMPQMDGLTALPKLLAIDPTVKILMSSTLTRRGAEVSIKALAAGAADYVPKPESTRDSNNALIFRRSLIEKIKVLGKSRRQHIGFRKSSDEARTARSRRAPVRIKVRSKSEITYREPSKRKSAILGIGSSTGGPQALLKVIAGLGAKFSVPIVITQHMPPTFTAILAEHISRATPLACSEAKDGEQLEENHIYIAPGDYHLTVSKKGMHYFAKLNQDEPENYCRPSVDQMFRSLAKVFGPAALALVLTGMGQDGLEGGKKLVDAGGTLVAQDEESSVVWGMPGAVATNGLCSAVLPIDKISPCLSRMVLRGAL